MAPKGAIRNTARVIGIEKDKRDYYLSLADRIAKLIPTKIGTTFATCETELLAAFAPDSGDDEDKAQMKEDALEIIEQAKMVEGVFLNYGMHAAGVIIADGNPIDDYVPLMKDEKSGDMKVQCNMTQAEELHGLLKFDFLGLRNLKIVTLAMRYIERNHGVKLNIENIPFDSNVFKNIFATGKTGSVFQFESAGMRQMLRSFKPDCFEDLVALVSLYRPGPMDFIPKYIEAKFHPETIKYLCPELEPILGKTYGCIVYQEQVMEIVQKLAGFSLSQADNVRRYMSKKKMDKLEHERESFINGDSERKIDGCLKRGISEEAANELFDQMIEFAKYAFNKSHAAAYAVLSYITAYMKYYYPAEYMCAVLNCTDNIKKMPSVLNDCREMEIKVLPPDVNKSELNFCVVDGSILFGLNSVKGTKIAYVKNIIKDREEYGLFVSFKDFMKRNLADKSTVEGLIYAGAMDNFNDNRFALIKTYEIGSELVSKIKAKKIDIEEKENKTEEEKSKKQFINSYEKAKATLEMLETQYEVLRIVDCPEDRKHRMKKEKEVLGFFISAHPLDDFRRPEELGCLPIDDLDSKLEKASIMGLIENYKVTNRKSDNKPMSFFDLEDKTGIIRVCCFTDAYAKFQELLGDDQIVKITGKVDAEVDEMTGETELQIFVEKVRAIKPDLNNIQIFISSLLEWNSCLKTLYDKEYITTEGHPLVVYDRLNGEYRKTNLYVKEEVLNDPLFTTRH